MNLSCERKKELIEKNKKELSINKQCELLSLSKGTFYYKAKETDPLNLILMNLIDEQYTKTPFYGTRKLAVYLIKMGYKVNRKRVQRLMRIMGIEAIYPKPNLSKRRLEHKIYPYLLKDVRINKPNQVWSTDITYIRIKGGFIYLAAVIDWYSRYVLSWKISNSLEVNFCIDALNDALIQGTPEIFNTDQGSQFTSDKFTEVLKGKNINISMDSKGRALDNIFVERLWRTLKYEEVYINDYQTIRESKISLNNYFIFYNNERFHQSLDYKVPREIHFQI